MYRYENVSPVDQMVPEVGLVAAGEVLESSVPIENANFKPVELKTLTPDQVIPAPAAAPAAPALAIDTPIEEATPQIAASNTSVQTPEVSQ